MARAHGISKYTLRFENPVTEAAFISQRMPRLIKKVKLLCCLAALLMIAVASINVARGEHKRRRFSSDRAHATSLMQLGIIGFIASLNVLSAFALQCGGLVNRIKPHVLDVMVTGWLIVTLLLGLLTLTRPNTSAKLMDVSFGEFDTDLSPRGSHSLLLIFLCITIAHSFLPLRWFATLPLAVVGVAAYMTQIFIIHRAEPLLNTAVNLSTLSMVVCLSSSGKYAFEVVEREAFSSIISERSMRCTAEFALSQKESPQQQEPERQSQSQPGSMPMTARTAFSETVSDRVFAQLRRCEGGDDLPEQLARVARIGETEHWLISPQQVRVLPDRAPLGSGSFGKVMLGVFSGILVAVKVPIAGISPGSLKGLRALCDELRIMRHLRHPNIVANHGAVVDPVQQQISLVLEYIAGVTLKAFIDSKHPNTTARTQVMVGVCSALLYLHTRTPKIIHGDLKHSNVMVKVDSAGTHPKLVDFGLSRLLTRRPQRLGGSLAWMSPEAVRGERAVSCATDVYSFGRLIAYVASGVVPFRGKGVPEIRELLLEGPPVLPVWREDCPFAPRCTSVVASCLRAAELLRPTISEVHRELLALPEELGLVDIGTSIFVTSARAIAETFAIQGSQANSQDAVAVSPAAAPPQPSARAAGGGGDAQPPAAAARAAPVGGRWRFGSLGHRLTYPGMAETTWLAKCTSVLELASRWNVKQPEGACCRLHAHVHAILEVCGDLMERGACGSAFGDEPVGCQCQVCGIFGLKSPEDQCAFCSLNEAARNGVWDAPTMKL